MVASQYRIQQGAVKLGVVLVLLVCAGIARAQVSIRCYNCIVPQGIIDIATYCAEAAACMGYYCTKGPDARSNGVQHACSNTPPLDGSAGECKTAATTVGSHSNCYCNNIDFCNVALLTKFSFVLCIVASIMSFVLPV